MNSRRGFVQFEEDRLGFTLVELIVGTAMVIVLTAMGIASYNSFNERQQVGNAAKELVTNIRSVSIKALGNEKDDTNVYCSATGDPLYGWYLKRNGNAYSTYGTCNPIDSPTDRFREKVVNLGADGFTLSFAQDPIIFYALGAAGGIAATNIAPGVSATITISDGTNTETVTIDSSGDVRLN